MVEQYTPEAIRALNAPTDKFLCKLADNTFGVRFGAYRIRDMDSGVTLIQVSAEEQKIGEAKALEEEMKDPENTDTRLIKYHFGPDFLKLQTIGL